MGISRGCILGDIWYFCPKVLFVAIKETRQKNRSLESSSGLQQDIFRIY